MNKLMIACFTAAGICSLSATANAAAPLYYKYAHRLTQQHYDHAAQSGQNARKPIFHRHILSFLSGALTP